MALVVGAVLAAPDRLPPPVVLAVPVHRALEALVEADPGPPAELGAELLGRERVAAGVARPGGDVLDQGLVAAGQLEYAPHHRDVLHLVGPAGVVGLARASLEQHLVDGV